MEQVGAEQVDTDEVFGRGWHALPKWHQLVLDAIAESKCDIEALLEELEQSETGEHQQNLSECLRNYIAAKRR